MTEVINCPHCDAEMEIPENAEKVECWSCSGRIELVAEPSHEPPPAQPASAQEYDDDEWEIVDVKKERHQAFMLASFASLAIGIGLWFAPRMSAWICAPFFLLGLVLSIVALVPRRSVLGFILLALALLLPGPMVGPRLVREINLTLSSGPKKDKEKAPITWVSPEMEKINADIQALKARKLRSLSTEIRDRVRISASRLQWRRTGTSTDPIAAFQIINYSRHTLSEVTLHAAITAPGNTEPMLETDFRYAFPAPLPPDANKGILAMPKELNSLANAEVSGRIDLKLSLTLVNARNASGKALIEIFTDADEKRLTELLAQQEQQQ